MKQILIFAVFAIVTYPSTEASAQAQHWPEQKAQSWYEKQPWLVGSNYIPADAINELEMWQEQTFDLPQIDKELGWAEALGMNTMRVFLHDLLWQQDQSGFKKRISSFLSVADRHHIRPIFVLFDSVWDPHPKLGPQHPPIPGVHNSGWVQSPGADGLADQSQYPRLRAYVEGVVGAFADDSRILAWDVWNEPSNTNGPPWSTQEPKNKRDLVLALLPQVFQWARSMKPIQPLTSGVWDGDWSSLEKLSPISRVQIEQSDVISFHHYGWAEDFEQRIKWLEAYHRPMICTEYMARSVGSTFDTILPIAKQHHVAAINWGFVAGKTQTYFPWDSWERPYVLAPPPIWFHDVLHPDGRPYREREAQILRELTGRGSQARSSP